MSIPKGITVTAFNEDGKKEFGEGISLMGPDKLIELTWLEKKVHILDRDTL